MHMKIDFTCVVLMDIDIIRFILRDVYVH